jgi:hypothetical protein
LQQFFEGKCDEEVRKQLKQEDQHIPKNRVKALDAKILNHFLYKYAPTEKAVHAEWQARADALGVQLPSKKSWDDCKPLHMGRSWNFDAQVLWSGDGIE